jgi:hypothetical protein
MGRSPAAQPLLRLISFGLTLDRSRLFNSGPSLPAAVSQAKLILALASRNSHALVSLTSRPAESRLFIAFHRFSSLFIAFHRSSSLFIAFHRSSSYFIALHRSGPRATNKRGSTNVYSRPLRVYLLTFARAPTPSSMRLKRMDAFVHSSNVFWKPQGPQSFPSPRPRHIIVTRPL